MGLRGDLKGSFITAVALTTFAVGGPLTVNASTTPQSAQATTSQTASYYQDGKIGDVAFSLSDNDTGKTLTLNTGDSGVINSTDVERVTASDNSQINIFPWNNTADKAAITKVEIVGAAKLQLNGTAAEYFFANLPNLTEISGMDKVDTSGATSLNATFASDPKLKNLDISSLRTPIVTDMQFIFDGDEALTSLDVSNLDTSKVTDLSYMFNDLPGITSLDVSKFNTQSATDMRNIFGNDSTLTNINIDNTKFDTSSVTDMSGMFTGDHALTTVDVSKFNTQNVVNMGWMFEDDWELNAVDVSHFDTQKVTNMNAMFANDLSLPNLDVSHFNTKGVADLSAMFFYDKKLATLDLSSFDTASLTAARPAVELDSMLAGLNLSELVLGPNTQLTDAVKLGAPNGSDQWQAVAGGTVANPLGDRGYLPNDLVALYNNTNNKLETWVPYSKVTLKVKSPIYLYVGDHFEPKTAFVSATSADGVNKTYDEATADGMTYDAGNLDTSKPSHYFVTYTYHLRTATVEVIVQDKSTPIPPTPGPMPTPTPEPAPSPTPTPNPQTSSQAATPQNLAPKGSAVYALNKIYLYKRANFNKRDRVAQYVQKPRVYWPMFVVTGYSHSTNGTLRYQVRDVNHLSKTAGKRGYITANWKYIRPVYYQSKHQTLTVINPRGVNAYKKVNLTGKVKNYKQGTILHVTRFVHHNLTTRYVLSNGQYITGNRKLVEMAKHKPARYVKVKRTINRYQTVNLTGHKKRIKKGTQIKIKNYDFSHATNLNQKGALRYRVAGGYITGNVKYVKVIK
ncbi:BspA family leucine-rich repeat surface protein [Lentilactobacillus kisonensis]|uniref:Bacterial surface protein 26-residue PARCEL repeat-containing domain protein n=2 Tax=Lentilactobacillus kisonensis TaxID=481722 RepID=H1LC95_9LACO|nr:BspA family leucine-rich repeat surface protein [Lentilactobacillus kisonensis]EHO54191.1 bacterial surface protein 26-residue PARCEL repeat-containing domain protein [Lentilactobacillus kisonensis F0435]KRL22696.1 bacterial surface protein 26-residue PARCEL repeat-containing domain protein [Lentilactobacillus kisonensis DSM 19906 = JCM 15041]